MSFVAPLQGASLCNPVDPGLKPLCVAPLGLLDVVRLTANIQINCGPRMAVWTPLQGVPDQEARWRMNWTKAAMPDSISSVVLEQNERRIWFSRPGARAK